MKANIKLSLSYANLDVNVYVAGIDEDQLNLFLTLLSGYASVNSLQFRKNAGFYQFVNNPALDVECLTREVEDIFYRLVGSGKTESKGEYAVKLVEHGSKLQFRVYFDTDSDTQSSVANAIRKGLRAIDLPGFEILMSDEVGSKSYQTALYNPLQSKRAKHEVLPLIHGECRKAGLVLTTLT